MVNLFGCISTTTRAVYAEHHSFHILVLKHFVQGLKHLSAHDSVSRVIGNLAGSIDHGYLIFSLVLFALNRSHLARVQYIVVLFTDKTFEYRVHLLTINETIHQSVLYIFLLRLNIHILVRILVQFLHRNITTLSHRFRHVIPDTVQIYFRLFAVGIGHRGAEERLYGRFESTHFEHLHLHAYLIQDTLIIPFRTAQTVPRNSTYLVQINLIRNGSDIIVHLSITL